jgi:hypothetical protein
VIFAPTAICSRVAYKYRARVKVFAPLLRILFGVKWAIGIREFDFS